MSLSSVTNRSVSLPPADSGEGPGSNLAALLNRPMDWGELRPALLRVSRETQAEIFFPALEHLAQRAEKMGKRDQARGIYKFLAGHSQVSGSQRERARRRLHLYQGQGSWVERIELGASGFVKEVTHPGMLLAMGFGSTAFRAGKLFATRLLNPVGPVRWGTRLASSAAGLGTEALTFTEVGRAYGHWSGQPQNLTAAEWGQQFASTAMVLGSLRSVGFGLSALGQVLHGPSLLSRPGLQTAYQQGGMYGGILLGHGALNYLGWYPDQSTPEFLMDSLGYLLTFNVAGALARNTIGRPLQPLERAMEARIQSSEARDLFSLSKGGLSFFPRPAWAVEGLPQPRDFSIPVVRMQSLTLRKPRPMNSLGLLSGSKEKTPVQYPAPLRKVQESTLRKLLEDGTVNDFHVSQDAWLSEFLKAHEITDHTMDLQMFRQGFQLGRRKPNLVRRIAFDMDEVILHWSFNVADLFRGLFKGNQEPRFQNTPPEILKYQSFEAVPEAKLPLSQRLWYGFLNRVASSRFRQTIQFHPAVRAYLLGMRSAVERPLTLATTGPAGRVLLLANEDPALKQIFFGKLPTESVSIQEVRQAPNIYTREDLVKAMRLLTEQEPSFSQDPLVRDYIQRIQDNPEKGAKLKHPALARILAKRPFNILVDDSKSTFDMLAPLREFTVLQPASFRPALTLNFAWFSPHRYLNRMGNGFVAELAKVLGDQEGSRSGRVPAGSLAKDYPIQRFTIEIPWRRYVSEFILPAQELKHLSEQITPMVLPEVGQYPQVPQPLSFPRDRQTTIIKRLNLELDGLLDGRPGRSAVHLQSGWELQRRAKEDADEFQKFLLNNFHSNELAWLRSSNDAISERDLDFFATLAGVLSAKRAALDLLGLPAEGHFQEIHFRYGRPVVYGKVAKRLGRGTIMTSQASGGEMGLGLALWEPAPGASGLRSLGVDITIPPAGPPSGKTDISPQHRALLEAAQKATVREKLQPGFGPQSKNQGKDPLELQPFLNGTYVLTGYHYNKGRGGHGEIPPLGNTLVQGKSFELGGAVLGLVAVPQVQPKGNPPLFKVSRKNRLGEYILDGNGYELGEPNQKIALIGDEGFGRVFELAKQGHRTFFIDWDHWKLYVSSETFMRINQKAIKDGEVDQELFADWVLADYYKTHTDAHAVEVFYPFSYYDLVVMGRDKVDLKVKSFMNEALHPKLRKEGGSVYLLTEVDLLVETMKKLIDKDPNLELVDFDLSDAKPPILGGHRAYPGWEQKEDSWILYRVKPK